MCFIFPIIVRCKVNIVFHKIQLLELVLFMRYWIVKYSTNYWHSFIMLTHLAKSVSLCVHAYVYVMHTTPYSEPSIDISSLLRWTETTHGKRPPWVYYLPVYDWYHPKNFRFNDPVRLGIAETLYIEANAPGINLQPAGFKKNIKLFG